MSRDDKLLDAWKSADWNILIGHAIHVAWGWLMFTGSLFSGPGGDLINAPWLPDPLYTLSLGANAAVLLVFALFGKGVGGLFKRNGVAVGAALLMAGGTFLASRFLPLLLGSPTVLVEILAGISTGIGTGTFLLLWGEVLVSLGVKGCLIYFAASSFLAALVHIVAGFTPLSVMQGAVCVAPVMELGFYRACVRSRGIVLARTNHRVTDSSSLPKNVLVLGLFFGLSFGAMRGWFAVFDHAELADARHIVSMLFVMAACILVYVMSVKRDIDFGRLTYQIALPMVALGFLLLPLSSVWSLAGTAAYRIGYQYMYIVLWGLWVWFARQQGASSVWIIACGLSSLQLSKLVGFVVSADFLSIPDLAADVPSFSGVFLFAIVVFALFAKDNAIPEGGWEGVRPAVETEEEAPSADQLYEMAAKQFALSPRETEVFFLLLKGRSRSYIAKELVVTEETVKSHIKGIYQKVGVHTKQDLIDRVEEIEG